MDKPISFGGGVNSTAMAIMLIEEGWRGELIFADTGAEWPETYIFMETFEEVYLRKFDMCITYLLPDKHSRFHPKRAKQSLMEYCLDQGIVPYRIARFCTQDWKIKPIMNYCQKKGLGFTSLGIAKEEAHRAKNKEKNDFPLLDRNIDREGCKKIIKDVGLCVPQKSGCYFCPYQRISQFKRLLGLHPDLFNKAMQMEESASKKRNKNVWIKEKISLRQIKEMEESQFKLFDVPENNQCWMCGY